MAMICFPTRLSPFSSSSSSSTRFPSRSHPSRRAGVALVVFSSHSNPCILKSSRRSRTERRTPSYDDEERENEIARKRNLRRTIFCSMSLDDDLSDVGDQFNFQLTKQSDKTGRLKVLRKRQENGSLKTGQSLRNSYGSVKDDVKTISKKTNMTISHPILNRSSNELVDLERNVKKKNDSFTENRYHKLAEVFGFDEKWFPLIEYLNTFGLKESDFICIYERHMPSLQVNLSSAQERLEFLMSVGVKHRDGFLILVYLIEEVGIKTTDIGKVVQLSPQILVQRIDSTWTLRFNCLSKELGAPSDSIVKMITKHSQLLHYSIENGILARINFLRSIGMCNSDILKVLTRLAQVLSLSLEGNLKPKYLYLVNELRNEDDLSDVGDQFNFQLTKQSDKTGRLKVLRKRQENGSLETGQSLRNSYGSVKDDVKTISKKTNMTISHPILNRSSNEHVDLERNVKGLMTIHLPQKKNDSFTENRYHKLAEDFGFDEKWFPLIEYLNTFGLKESDFICIYERHMPCLQINLSSAQERLEFLISVGVRHRDVRRILIRQPQILEYTVENNLKYLIEEVGIRKTDIGKVVQLSPQILVQRIDSTGTLRFNFLSKELGAPKDSIVKMVAKHPQLLHYSIKNGILPRINFLRSIGMCNSDILKVLTSLTQVLSLSLEGNLKPKIRPRHRFLVSLKKAPKGPFPLSSLVSTDECVCQQWVLVNSGLDLAWRSIWHLDRVYKWPALVFSLEKLFPIEISTPFSLEYAQVYCRLSAGHCSPLERRPVRVFEPAATALLLPPLASADTGRRLPPFPFSS
ncbi:hypothetical protein ZIOFF_067355 [Zingiber officinale]|uniref:Transcription termination factor MTERF9, chloroplastic n=1 Tax=Zingiber officinale TaxID=94328 RepID=A0A8J5CDP7_ZINOF|nr:hypothetical protein ZIOFF_067355 [Zingiber officinale]